MQVLTLTREASVVKKASEKNLPSEEKTKPKKAKKHRASDAKRTGDRSARSEGKEALAKGERSLEVKMLKSGSGGENREENSSIESGQGSQKDALVRGLSTARRKTRPDAALLKSDGVKRQETSLVLLRFEFSLCALLPIFGIPSCSFLNLTPS
jgi:hypothetical protein